MEKIINRVVRAYKSTRELTEQQEALVHSGISTIVASLIEIQAVKLERSNSLADQA